jgi:NhaP-type Na+/H+ and K+/H+ antiporter
MIPFVFAGPVAIMLVGLVVNTLTGAIQGTGIAAVYVDLRIVKEGGNTDALADVFA